jgi:hypothetical protein
MKIIIKRLSYLHYPFVEIQCLRSGIFQFPSQTDKIEKAYQFNSVDDAVMMLSSLHQNINLFEFNYIEENTIIGCAQQGNYQI